MDPIETSELLAFTKAVDSNSLSKAARDLRVPRATISRRLARLEERLGARLLRRTTRSLVLTDAGTSLYRHARIVLDAVAQAESSVRKTDNAIRGDLRVSVPPIVDEGFLEMLSTFALDNPEVRLHVHFAAKHVDLRRDGFDVALRATATTSGNNAALEAGLTVRTIGRFPLVAVASPAYLKRNGTPKLRRDLRKHRCLMGFAGDDRPQSYWPTKNGGSIHIEGALFSNSLALLANAATRGMGIACLPAVFVKDRLADGSLVHVLADVIGAESRIGIVYVDREFVPPQVRAFVDTLAKWQAKTAALTPSRGL